MTREPDKPIGEILRELFADFTGIVRSELRLLKMEVRGEVAQIIRAAPLIAVGALLGVYAIGLLLTAILLLIGTVLPYWGAALILFGFTAGLAAVCLLVGRLALREVHPPVQTMASLKENAEWLSSQVK